MSLFFVTQGSVTGLGNSTRIVEAAEVDRKVHLGSTTNMVVGFTEQEVDDMITASNQMLSQNLPTFVLPAGKELWLAPAGSSQTFYRLMVTNVG